MKVEVLAAAMFQTDLSLYTAMNLQTDALIINQCDRLKREEASMNGHRVRMFSVPERGVGRSRNCALMAAEGDVCMIADQDMRYVDGYETIVTDAFRRWPDADAVLFQIDSLNPKRPLVKVKKNGRARRKDVMALGGCRLAFKRKRALAENLWFSLLFGGGAPYGSGEDSLFFDAMLRKGLKLYTCTQKIADVSQEDSSWFKGYTEKYFKDKGVLYTAMYGKKAGFLLPFFAGRIFLRLKGKFSYQCILRNVRGGMKEIREMGWE